MGENIFVLLLNINREKMSRQSIVFLFTMLFLIDRHVSNLTNLRDSYGEFFYNFKGKQIFHLQFFFLFGGISLIITK